MRDLINKILQSDFVQRLSSRKFLLTLLTILLLWLDATQLHLLDTDTKLLLVGTVVAFITAEGVADARKAGSPTVHVEVPELSEEEKS